MRIKNGFKCRNILGAIPIATMEAIPRLEERLATRESERVHGRDLRELDDEEDHEEGKTPQLIFLKSFLGCTSRLKH